MIDTVNEQANGHRATVAPPEGAPDAVPLGDGTLETAPAGRMDAPAPRAKRRRSMTYNQFLLMQLPLFATLALVIVAISFAVATQRPVGVAATDSGAAVAAPASVPDGPITAFASGTAPQQIAVAADPTGAFKWDKATYEVQAGDVTFVVTNKSSSTHNFAVEGPNVQAQSANFGANSTNSYTLRGLKPGEYLIVCNFPGHRAAGMVAKLIVK